MDGLAEGARYRAFLSYSHKDADFARRLHRRLESYRLPRRLVGRTTARGAVPARLAPIFRDREELSAARDLSSEVRAALAASACLIVVCSPDAAASAWVEREIELFHELHPSAPVLAALIRGEPAAALPPAMRWTGGEDTVEPLAADFRPEGDGRRLGLLKLVAGAAGIGLDELVQRDAQRRHRRVTAVTGAAVAASLVMALLTAVALGARAEAERQRAEAEGLVKFMLTDLRSKLKGVGRLDVMIAVNERLLEHCRDEERGHAPVLDLAQCAKSLQAAGEDDLTLGRPELAMDQFREAKRITSTLLAAAPQDDERIFDDAQSDFWLGDFYYFQERPAAAMREFKAYERAAEQLEALQPTNPRYVREVGYAQSNLCTVGLKSPSPRQALADCKAALESTGRAARLLGLKSDILDDVVNRHAWLADAYLAAGDPERARTERLTEQHLLDRQLAADPENERLNDVQAAIESGLARVDEAEHQDEAARGHLKRALAMQSSLSAHDPKNKRWRDNEVWIARELAGLKSRSGTKEIGK